VVVAATVSGGEVGGSLLLLLLSRCCSWCWGVRWALGQLSPRGRGCGRVGSSWGTEGCKGARVAAGGVEVAGALFPHGCCCSLCCPSSAWECSRAGTGAMQGLLPTPFGCQSPLGARVVVVLLLQPEGLPSRVQLLARGWQGKEPLLLCGTWGGAWDCGGAANMTGCSWSKGVHGGAALGSGGAACWASHRAIEAMLWMPKAPQGQPPTPPTMLAKHVEAWLPVQQVPGRGCPGHLLLPLLPLPLHLQLLLPFFTLLPLPLLLLPLLQLLLLPLPPLLLQLLLLAGPPGPRRPSARTPLPPCPRPGCWRGWQGPDLQGRPLPPGALASQRLPHHHHLTPKQVHHHLQRQARGRTACLVTPGGACSRSDDDIERLPPRTCTGDDIERLPPRTCTGDDIERLPPRTCTGAPPPPAATKLWVGWSSLSCSNAQGRFCAPAPIRFHSTHHRPLLAPSTLHLIAHWFDTGPGVWTPTPPTFAGSTGASPLLLPPVACSE